MDPEVAMHSIQSGEYDLVESVPGVDDYLRLRNISGLSAFSTVAAEQGLEGTVFGVTVLFDGKPVGMGRVIGDGGCFFQVVDIAVDPDHQGNGLGKAVMSAIVEYLRHNVPATAYVSLIADIPADRLYAQFGFEPTGPRSIGMALARDQSEFGSD